MPNRQPTTRLASKRFPEASRLCIVLLLSLDFVSVDIVTSNQLDFAPAPTLLVGHLCQATCSFHHDVDATGSARPLSCPELTH